jgi:hypothetical protein
MEREQPISIKALLLSAAKGGVLAVVAPIALGLFFMLIVSGDAQQGVGWMLIAGFLAAPVIFLLGAGGGVVAYLARSRAAGAPVGQQTTTRWARVGWIVAGALAGMLASGLTTFQWPMTGGVLIGMALIPVWMWIGAVVGHRIGLSKSPLRPVLGGALAAVAAYTAIGFGMAAMIIGHVSVPDAAHRIAPVGVAAVAGLFAFWRLRGAQSVRESPSADPSAGERDR